MTDDIRTIWDIAVQRGYERGWIRGRLGKPESSGYRVRVPGRPGWVFFRPGITGDQGVTQARNMGVAERPDMPVKARREKGELVIYGTDEATIVQFTGSGSDIGNTGPHTHRRGSGLEYEIEMERLDAGRVSYFSGMVVYIAPFRYQRKDGSWDTWMGGTIDLTSYAPAAANTWAWVLVGVDPVTNTAAAAAGTAQPIAASLSLELIDDIGFGDNIPCGGVKVRAGATTLSDWRNYEDAHGWFNTGIAGSVSVPVVGETLLDDSDPRETLYDDDGDILYEG